ncbi:hypothetical protein OHB24_17280 [Kribbella sp. NBC_00482]
MTQPGVRQDPAEIDEGTTFTSKAGPGTIRSVIGAVDRPRLMS